MNIPYKSSSTIRVTGSSCKWQKPCNLPLSNRYMFLGTFAKRFKLSRMIIKKKIIKSNRWWMCLQQVPPLMSWFRVAFYSQSRSLLDFPPRTRPQGEKNLFRQQKAYRFTTLCFGYRWWMRIMRCYLDPVCSTLSSLRRIAVKEFIIEARKKTVHSIMKRRAREGRRKHSALQLK